MAQAIPAVLAVGGSLIKGVAGMKAAKSNKKALFGQALETERTGNAQILRIRDEARAAIGRQIGAQYDNGFLGGAGSALDAITESQVNAALDARTVRREAELKAMSYRAEGRQGVKASKWAMAGELVGAAGKVFGMADDWAQAGRGTTSGGGGGG